MKEIIISTQTEFDALKSPKEFTTIYITGELFKVNREIENAIIRITGSAKVDSITDSAKVGSITDSARVGSITDSAKVDYITDSAKVGSITGSARVDYITGSARVGSITGSANVGSIIDSARVGSITGSANVGSITDSARVGSITGSARVGSITDSAKVDYITDSAKVGSITGSVRVGSITDSAKVDYITDSAKVDYIAGSARVDYITDSARVDYITDSAKVDYIAGSARVDYITGYGSANIYNDCSPNLQGYAAVWAFNDKCKPKKQNPSTVIIRPSLDPLDMYINSNPIDASGKTVLLYKRVSKDFLTQEGGKNETLWQVGKKIEHPNWNPTDDECGEGKFHACSKPLFCDQFRDKVDDRYICIEVNKKDLFAWKNPSYPRKIAFKKGTILYECDKAGDVLKQEKV